MKLTEHALLKEYVNEGVKVLKRAVPSLPEKYLENYVWRRVLNTVKDQQCEISNTYEEFDYNASLLSVLHYIKDKRPIVTGCGSLFKQHSEEISPANEMLLAFKANRDIMKNEMFEYKLAGDKRREMIKDLGQKNEKKKMNAFYGSQGKNVSFQYNPATPPATTSQGRSITSTTLWFFESFIGNNVIFETFDDISHYISLVADEEVNQKWYSYIDYKPDATEITNELFKHYEGRSENRKNYWAYANMMIKNLSDEHKIKLYYKNNFDAFVEKNPKFNKLLDEMVGNDEEYLNPYKIPPKLQVMFDELMGVVDEFIYMKEYIQYNKVRRFETHERDTITYSDTDSVFVYIGKWVIQRYMSFKNVAYEDIKMSLLLSDMKLLLKICNIIINVIFVEIHKTYDTLTKNVHITPDYRKYINIKNELVIERYVTYPDKKNYILRVIAQEGRILTKPELDYKGLKLNPKSRNKKVTKRIKDITSEVTMDKDTVSPEEFLWHIFKFRDEIVESLQRGEVDYLIPIKVKDADSYKANPADLYTYKSVMDYMELSQSKNITIPGSFYLIDVSITKENCESLKDTHPEIYERLQKRLTKVTRANTTIETIDYLSIPQAEERIPDWIIPFIDAWGIANKHENPLITLSESFGFAPEKIATTRYYSTILSF